jgi:hypothetical protein
MVDGRMKFKVSHPDGRELVIECSTNLQQWVPVCTNSTTSSFSEFIDPDAATAPKKYFRARVR